MRQTSAGQMMGIGLLLIAGGATAARFGWFPPPPLSNFAPLTGASARWFAVGICWFGLAVLIAGVEQHRVTDRSRRLMSRIAGVAILLALASWTGWLLCLLK